MVTQDYLRNFLTLLESGSDEEIEARKHLLLKAIHDRHLSRDMVADCRFLARKIQEEQMARSEIKTAARFAQAKQA